MTDKELMDAFLTGDLDEAGMARLEAELKANPDLVRELSDQQNIEQALKVLLGDDTADQQVTVSVLSVLRADPIDSFKNDLLAHVRKEADLKRREEEAAKAPVAPPPVPEVAEAFRPPVAPAPVRTPRRRVVPWAVAGSIAAAGLIALGIALYPAGVKSSAADAHAFLLSVGPGARLTREGRVLPIRVDMELVSGDRLTLDEPGETRIGFADDPTRLKIKGPAVFHFVQGGAAKRIELLKGDCEIAAPLQVEPFTAVTPHSELRFREGDVRLVSAADFARLEVRRGKASFTSRRDHKTIDVAADFYAVAGKDVELVAKGLDRTLPSPDGPGVVAVLRRVQGEVYVFSQSPADRTPAKPGRAILEGQAILTESRSSVVLDYPDHTRLEIGSDTVVRRLTDQKDRTRKLVTLERGALVADVAKQPAGKAMLLRTPQAEVAVLGTRFTLAAETEATRLQVEEGAVNFTRMEDRKTIQVRSGFYAVAAPGKPLDPAPLPGGVRYLDIDLNAGVTSGDGEWAVEGRTVKQGRVSRLAEGGASTLLCRAESEDKDSLVLEVVVDVDAATPDTAIDRGSWGFGLEAMFRDRTVVLRSAQGPEGTSVFEFPGVSAIPFEHGREGTYRLKLSIERKRGSDTVLRGKIWQGDREPDGWMIESVSDLDGPMTQVGLQTARSACTFSSFKVKVLKDESR
ncbi:MAG TPA: FecR family protein [Planctomycetota bacterium]|nr:FecR family protein [Planctomycetota bacterium]